MTHGPGRLFDFDGTLVDTMPGLVTAVNHWRQEYGRPVADEAEIRAWVGHGVDDLLGRAVGGVAVDAAAKARFLEIYRGDPLLTARPFAGIEPLLDALAERCVPVAIVTNKPRMATLALLEALGWMARFSAIVCPEDAGTRKPDPAMLTHATERLPSPRGGWIMIGDSEVDMQAGVQANLPTIGVTWGYREQAALVAAGARRLVNRPEQLLDPA